MVFAEFESPVGFHRCDRVIANALGWMDAEQARHIGRMHADQLVSSRQYTDGAAPSFRFAQPSRSDATDKALHDYPD
ncbi:hypothetical protein [Paraburkholderia sp. RL17-373-BIF-A]|uniref:hypothetical protein n=1 Tax=Paraburkholderia sp. RL17-373-BIF-A TaxID=3031629 RepID=UPI0038BC6D60